MTHNRMYQPYRSYNSNGNKESGEFSEIRVFLGSFVHSEDKNNPLVIVSNGVIGVERGKIVFIDVEDNLEALKDKYSFSTDNIYVIGRGEFLVPGFVDTHIHAPQYPNAGLGIDLRLLDWLVRYTFPMEARFADPAFARSSYKKVVQRTLANGTTTASYFGTIHRQSTEILAEIVDQYGQRALVGKVCMDCYSPDFYVETTQESLKSTEEFIINMLKRKSTRVQPIITPRFALSCSPELLTGLGELARKYDVRIQSHLCESEEEIGRAMKLFPQYKSYTDIYHKTGLLTKNTIMAHCVFLNEDEIKTIVNAQTGIAHCPTSNLCLLSGICPVKSYLSKGIKVGLGTDVSGGYSSSILEAMRHAILASKVLKIQGSNEEQLTYKDALYLATLGGAQALSLDDIIGNFQVGKRFDACHVDIAAAGSPIHSFGPGESLDEMIQKFIMLGDDRNIIQVFVDGRKVKIAL